MTKQNKVKKQQEQGRSMVEMLGVLAVVGVLSVGGIAGYTYAMNRHYTNEILAGASERAVLIASQIAFNQPLSLREFTDDMNKTGGGTFSEDVVEGLEGEFGIKVTGVKEAVCENIIEVAEESNSIQAITAVDSPDTAFIKDDCAGGNKSFVMIYNNDIGHEKSEASKGRCSDSEKIEKFYNAGECCDDFRSGQFCPDEEVPSCTISESNLATCKSNCYRWDEINNQCCDNSVTAGCCEINGGVLDIRNICCGEEYDFDSAGICCQNGHESEECCKNSGGKLDNTNSCCWMHLDSAGNCCPEPKDDGMCCVDAYESDFCCQQLFGGSNGGLDEDGNCCDEYGACV